MSATRSGGAGSAGGRKPRADAGAAAAERDHIVQLQEALLDAAREGTLGARLAALTQSLRASGHRRVVLVAKTSESAPPVVSAVGRDAADTAALQWRVLSGGAAGEEFEVVPVRASEGTEVGAIWLESPLTDVPGATPRAIALFARQLASLIGQASLAEVAERRAAWLQRLQEVGTGLARSLDETEIYREIARQVARVVPADGFLIVQPDLERGETRTLLRLLNGVDSPREPVPLAGGVVGEVARTGRPVRVSDDAVASPLAAADDVVPEGVSAGSLLAVPLLSGSRLLGVMVAFTHEVGRYHDEDMEVLLTIAAQAASAITNARLYAESERERRQSEALAEIARAVSESLRLGEVLHLILRHAVALLRGEGASLSLREADYLHVVAAVGSASLTAGMQVPMQGSVSGAVMASGQYEIIGDVAADPRSYRMTQRVANIRNACVVPLITGRGTIGVITVTNRDDGFEDTDARVLQRLADQVAVAIVNARLFEEVATATQEWRVAFDAIPSGLLVLDDDGRIARFNARALQLAGMEREHTLLGRRFGEAVLHEPGPEADDAPVPRSLREGVTTRATLRAPHRGKIFDIVASPHPSGGAVVTFDDVTELHALAERHRRVVETSTDAIVITDLGRRISFANPAAAELFARQGELIGALVDDLLAPGQSEIVRDHEQMALAGRPQHYEAVILRPDGDQRIVSVSTAPLRDIGEVTGIVASLRDVTDERRARDAVLLSESRYRNLFETASDLILTLDAKGGITSANEAACRVAGLAAGEVLGRNVTVFLAPEDVPATMEHFRAVLTGENRRYECRLRRASGELRLLSITNTPIRHGREVIGVLGIARDITDDRARAEALARSEARYTHLVESASDAIFTVDEEGNFTSVNKALEATMGRSRRQLIGRHFTTVLEGSPDRDKLWVVFAEALRGNRQRAEFRFVSARGELRTGSIMSAPISEGDRVTGGLAVVRDVTDEKALVQQLLQQEKLAAIGQLVSGVAHELNNPLAGVMAFSQLLLASPLPDEQRQAAETIQHEGRRAAKIVSNLLTFARQHPPERSLTNLNQVLRDTVSLRRYAMQVGQVELDAQLDEQLPATWADPFQLQQVFLNLLTNAEQAVGSNTGAKRVVLRSARAGPLLLVSVGDNGPGISAEQRDRIFNPFYTTKPVGQGTGLGLSISDGIVREHGGRIRVESELGAGATFVVELPLSGEPGAADTEPAPAPRKRSILFIGGVEPDRSTRVRSLERDGHEVIVVASGDAALRRAEERPWDAVVLDLHLPDMSGSRLYGRLMATAPRVAERVVFLSDPVREDGELDWLRGTGRAHLVNPFPHQALVQALWAGRVR